MHFKDDQDTWIAVNIRQLNAADETWIVLAESWRDIPGAGEPKEMFAQARCKKLEAEILLGQVETRAAIGFGLISGADGRRISVNPNRCELLRRDEHTLLNRTWRDFTHPDDRFRDAGLLDNIKANLIPSYRLSQRWIKANGDIAWGETSISCIRNRDESADPFITEVVDIAKHKKYPGKT